MPARRLGCGVFPLSLCWAALPASCAWTAFPERLIDDRLMFAKIRLLVVNDLAPVNAVLQHQIERTAGKWFATRDPARGACPQLALDAQGLQLVSQPPDRAEFGIAAKNEAHDFRLAFDDDELAVLRLIAKRRHPPIHIPFFFEAAILSRMRSPMTSRSNCAKDNK